MCGKRIHQSLTFWLVSSYLLIVLVSSELVFGLSLTPTDSHSSNSWSEPSTVEHHQDVTLAPMRSTDSVHTLKIRIRPGKIMKKIVRDIKGFVERSADFVGEKLSKGSHSNSEPVPDNNVEQVASPTKEIPDAPAFDPQLYANSDHELEQLLSSIKEELLESKTHPANFVQDDAELEYILSRLKEDENVIESRLKRWEDGLPPVYVVDVCPICRDDMEPNNADNVRLECSHEFHTDCVKRFLDSNEDHVPHFMCPACRRLAPKERVYQAMANRHQH